MNEKSVLHASGIALVLLGAWWVGVRYLDGFLAAALPYHRYETVGLLYPEVYYPALPGWILAHSQPFPAGIWLVTAGWMIALSVTVGVAATRYASGRKSSPAGAAAAIVVVLFVAVTIAEAAASLLA